MKIDDVSIDVGEPVQDEKQTITSLPISSTFVLCDKEDKPLTKLPFQCDGVGLLDEKELAQFATLHKKLNDGVTALIEKQYS